MSRVSQVWKPLPLRPASAKLFPPFEGRSYPLPMTESTRNASEDLAELVEACPFPVIQCDVQGRVLLTNTAFLNLLEILNIPHDQASRILARRVYCAT